MEKWQKGMFVSFVAGILTYLLLLPSISSALVNFSIGAKVGPTLGRLWGPSAEGVEQGFAVRLGVEGVVGVEFNKYLEAEVGIGLSQRGETCSGTDEITGQKGKAYIHLNYLNFPIVAKIKAPFRLVKPYLLLGIEPAIWLSGKYKAEVGGQTVVEVSIEREHIERVDFGFDFGAGVEAEIKSLVPFLDFKYTLGVVDIVPEGEEIKTDTLVVLVGLKYKF